MVYELPKRVAGQTHVEVFEVYATVGSLRMIVSSRLGKMEPDGDDEEIFVPNLDVGQIFRREISGPECEAFLAYCSSKGAPDGEWREADVAAWVGTFGVAMSTWTPKKAAPS